MNEIEVTLDELREKYLEAIRFYNEIMYPNHQEKIEKIMKEILEG